MIKFFSQNKSGVPFELDVSNLKISFIEESNLFYDYFIKGYSLPFSIALTDEISRKFEFIDDFNTIGYSVRYEGVLQIDDVFDVATLQLKRQKGKKMESTFFYGKENVPFLEKKISEFPWPVINVEDLRTYAQSIIGKTYPEVDFNFPMVHHTGFSPENYDRFLGFLNHHNGSGFISNGYTTVDGEQVPNNANAMVPMPSVLAILKTIFESENYIVLGNFVNHVAIKKTLLFTDKHLLKYESTLPENYQFKSGSELWSSGVTTSTYYKRFNIGLVGSYSINCRFNLPRETSFELTVSFGDAEYLSKNSDFEETFSFNVESQEELGFLTFDLKVKKGGPSNTNVGSIEAYNLIQFEFEGGELNIFPKSFTLGQVLPDMKVKTFLNRLKNYFNLDVAIDKNRVYLNFAEDEFLRKQEFDESKFEQEDPERYFTTKKLYVLKSNQEEILIDATGIVNSREGYSDEEITTIDTQVEMMPVLETPNGFTAVKKDDGLDFQLLFYDGLKNGLPLAVSNIDGFTFSLKEVHQNLWRKWLLFRLRSETIKDKFKISIHDLISIDRIRIKYNKKHLYKKIRRSRINDETWEIEVESETL